MASRLSALIMLLSKLSFTNLRTAGKVLVRSGPAALFSPLIWLIFKRTDSTFTENKNYFLEEEPLSEDTIGETKVLFIVHIHFPEFVKRFQKGVAKLSQDRWRYVVTSSNPKILEEIESAQGLNGLPSVSTMLLPNRGRNISPFIEALREHGQGSEIIIHIHSKKSEHADPQLGRHWANIQWGPLFENPEIVSRVLGVFKSNPEISIVYPAVEGLLSPWTYTWAANSKMARRLLKPLGIAVKSWERIAFPAGGMFAARKMDLDYLEKMDLGPESFPNETGQLDGQTQHAIERLLGYVPEKTGKLHAIYLTKNDAFTSDTRTLTENYEWSSFGQKNTSH